MMSGTNLTPSGGAPPKRSRAGAIALVGLMAVVLFGAGVGISWLLRGGSSSDAAAAPTPSGSCVRTTVVPGVGLPKPGTVTVNVYNATDRRGLAARTSSALGGRGFVTGKVANDPLGNTVTVSAEIRYGPQGKKNAQLVSFYVAGSKLVPDTRGDATVDLVLGDRFKALQTPAAVQAALTKPTVVVSGTGCAATKPAASKSPKASPKPSASR